MIDQVVLINGVVSDGRVAVTDSSVVRGDGCFEAIRVYQGTPFAVDAHLQRLQRSAAKLEIPLPTLSTISGWVFAVADEQIDCLVRVIVTRGGAVPGVDPSPTVIVFGHPLPPPRPSSRLLPIVAPWHDAGELWELSSAKTLSYAPNLAATRSARSAGFDDALLLSKEGIILEGPTFSVAWVVDGELETPDLTLGILDSITRQTIVEIAGSRQVRLSFGEWDLGHLRQASEVMALSTVREVQPVVAVGDLTFPEGPVARLLAEEFGYLSGPAD